MGMEEKAEPKSSGTSTRFLEGAAITARALAA
jgi:hypothetical protein